jgi:hypothetical protein
MNLRGRYVILLALLLGHLACAALRAESPVFDWKQAAKAHEEAQKTGICEVHKMKMTAEAVPIHWGEAVPPAPGEPTCQYRMAHFPNYVTVVEGGCCKIPGKKSEMTFICPKCKEAAIAWTSKK